MERVKGGQLLELIPIKRPAFDREIPFENKRIEVRLSAEGAVFLLDADHSKASPCGVGAEREARGVRE